MAAYRRVYDSRHLQADCQELGSAPEPYAWQSSMDGLALPFSGLLTGSGHFKLLKLNYWGRKAGEGGKQSAPGFRQNNHTNTSSDVSHTRHQHADPGLPRHARSHYNTTGRRVRRRAREEVARISYCVHLMIIISRFFSRFGFNTL